MVRQGSAGGCDGNLDRDTVSKLDPICRSAYVRMDDLRECIMAEAEKKPPQTLSIRLSEKEGTGLNKLREKLRARNNSEAARRSIVQTSRIIDLADDDGFITLIDPRSGREVRIPIDW